MTIDAQEAVLAAYQYQTGLGRALRDTEASAGPSAFEQVSIEEVSQAEAAQAESARRDANHPRQQMRAIFVSPASAPSE